MSVYKTIRYASLGVEVYATLDDLPLSDVEEGSQALVDSNNKLYIYSDTGWYNIAIVNQSPSISNVESSYTLTSGSDTVITVVAEDPEGFPVTYSIASDTSGNTATVTQGSGANTNIFTITPSTDSADAGTFTLTFRASDGTNIGSAAAEFTLEFSISDSNYTTALITSVGDNNDVNNSFTDSSTNNLTITAVGNATGGGHTPYRSGGYSVFFDGNGDYLASDNNDIGNFGTDDFTVEGWFWVLDRSALYTVVDGRSTTLTDASGWSVAINTSGGIYVYTGGFHIEGTNGDVEEETWHHWALTRSSGDMKLFLNGTQQGSTNSTARNFTANLFRVGASGTGGEVFKGYQRDVRVVKGTALYTSNFTVPDEPLTAVTNTSFLGCHLPYFVDGSTNGHSITVNGDAKTDSFSPYDYAEYTSSLVGGSIYLDGSGDYLTTSASSEQTVGTGQFTLECWFKVTQDTQQTILALMAGSTNVLNIFYYHTNDSIGITDSVWLTGNAGSGDNHEIITRNTWHHLAVVRDSTNLKLYVNGIERYSGSNSTNYNNDRVWIGYNQYGNALRGNIADVRLVKGTAVYTSNFTPPTAPLSAITNTALLVSGTDAGIIDKSQSSWGVTLFSGAKSSTAQSKYLSSSIAFNGTSDWLRVYSHETIDFNNGDFTIEGWMYCTDYSSTRYILDARTSSTTGVNGIWLMSTRVLRIYNGGLYDTAAISASDLDSQWLHFAVCRNNTTLQWYINGTASGSAHSVNTNSFFGQQYDNWAIGRNNYTAVGYFHGYMSDLRFTKGLARYTSNFTPPTEALKG